MVESSILIELSSDIETILKRNENTASNREKVIQKKYRIGAGLIL